MEHLGRPYDAKFQPLIGAGAGSLFPSAGAPLKIALNRYEFQSKLVTSTDQLSANFHGWGLEAGASTTTSNRYAYYRAVQLSDVYELHDATQMNAAPSGAVYYPWRIYYGHSYVSTLSGTSSSFSAEIGAEFLAWGGEAKAFASNHKLFAGKAGVGLVPKTASAIFAKTTAEIESSYEASGSPAPILVEYRRIPSVPSTDQPIVWESAPKKKVEVRFNSVQVMSHGSAFYDYSNWSMTARCKVNGEFVGEPVAFLGRKVSNGNYPVVFSRQFEVTDADGIECEVTGTYSRYQSSPALGGSTTGRISTGMLPKIGLATGLDANTRYNVYWTASALP